MGLPALKHDTHRAQPRGPRLRVVKSRPSSKKSTRSRANANEAAAQAFVFFAVVVVIVAALGFGRIWLSVRAAQASMDSTRLRSEIKLEQYEGDMLEVQQSALATPSRIQALAGGAMGMRPAKSVA
ncbi:MAG: hypothetical protein HGB10_04845, partial [Coriobacteriia bacterium]|nr:hypothetical protein [Coriobacteriia bacterium]